MTAVSKTYVMRITLTGIEPPVWRRLLVSPEMTLHDLHLTFQMIFSWLDCHLYQFKIKGKRYSAPDEESEALDATRASLGSFRLKVHDRFVYTYDLGDHWDHEVFVEEIHPEGLPHAVAILVDGARAGPPEDCGGAHGYEQLLDALRTPPDDRDEPGRELADWVDPDFDPEGFELHQARLALTRMFAWGIVDSE